MPTYTLDEKGDPVLTEIEKLDLSEANIRVAKTVIGRTGVSTVFLGIDHNYGDGPPILFETMVFADDDSTDQRRYHTLGEAVRGHQAMVEKVFGKNSGARTQWGRLGHLYWNRVGWNRVDSTASRRSAWDRLLDED